MVPNDASTGGCFVSTTTTMPVSIMNSKAKELMFDKKDNGCCCSSASRPHVWSENNYLHSDWSNRRATGDCPSSNNNSVLPTEPPRSSTKTCIAYTTTPKEITTTPPPGSLLQQQYRGRRVIFPWLHYPPPPTELLQISEPVPSHTQSLPKEILLLLTSPHPLRQLRSTTTEATMCRQTQLPTTSSRLGIQIGELQIPPFKGAAVYPSESSTLAAATCLVGGSMASPELFRPHCCQTNIGQTQKPKQPLRSILRSKSDRTVDCKQLATLDFGVRRSSSPPLLVSLQDEEEDDSQSSSGTDCDSSFLRSSSSSRAISFDPRVWVREFCRSEDEKNSIWYSPKDLDRFKNQTLTRILEFRGRSKLIATGTGRMVQTPTKTPISKALYTNPALVLESEDDDDDLKGEMTAFQSAVLECEIRNILLVDPHDICLQLMEKSFKRILPQATITTARGSEEALQYHGAQSFDVVLVEERLHYLFHRQDIKSQTGDESEIPVSGSSLIRRMASSSGGTNCLFIGMSANLDQDRASLEESGTDLVWTKPPPSMNSHIRDTILHMILRKRGRCALATALFGTKQES